MCGCAHSVPQVHAENCRCRGSFRVALVAALGAARRRAGGGPAAARSAGGPGPAEHDVRGLQADPGRRLGDQRRGADGPQRHDRARRVRLLRPAVRDHAAEEERSVRQPADRSDPARGRAEVLRGLLQHAERAQPRAHDQRLLDGAVRRHASASPTSRPTAPTGCRRSSTSTGSTTSASRASRPARRLPGRPHLQRQHGQRRQRRLGGGRRQRPQPVRPDPVSSTPATTRRRSGRSSAR